MRIKAYIVLCAALVACEPPPAYDQPAPPYLEPEGQDAGAPADAAAVDAFVTGYELRCERQYQVVDVEAGAAGEWRAVLPVTEHCVSAVCATAPEADLTGARVEFFDGSIMPLVLPGTSEQLGDGRWPYCAQWYILQWFPHVGDSEIAVTLSGFASEPYLVVMY